MLLLALLLLALVVCMPRVAVSAVKPGAAAKAYRNTGTYGSPTWTEMKLVKSVTPNFPWDMVEAGSRETRAKLYAKARVDLGIQFDMRADDLEANYNAVADAACSATTLLDLMFLNAAITVVGCRGFRAQWNINLTGAPQEIDGTVYDQFEAKPGWTSDGYPSTVVMGATSTPAFTAM